MKIFPKITKNAIFLHTLPGAPRGPQMARRAPKSSKWCETRTCWKWKKCQKFEKFVRSRAFFFFSFWKCQKLKKCSKNDKSAQKWSKVLKKWQKVNEKPSKPPLSWRVQSWEWSYFVREIISRLMGCFPLDFEFFASGGSYGPGSIKTVVNMPTAIILRFDSSKSMAWASS